MQFAPLLATHEGLWRADGKTRPITLDQNRADAAKSGAEAHIDEKDMRVRAESGEHFPAVDHVMRAVGARAGFQIGDRRTCIRLSHAKAHHDTAGEKLAEPARFLLRRAVFGKGAD